ncbi:MAG: hypothetical protein R2748_01005 [Bryobacterales bacterium]
MTGALHTRNREPAGTRIPASASAWPPILCCAMPPGTPEMTFNLGPAGDRKRGEIILREELDFANQTIASATGQGQLAYYKLLEEQGWLRMIRTQADLEGVRGLGSRGCADTPIGCYIPSMKDAIRCYACHR